MGNESQLKLKSAKKEPQLKWNLGCIVLFPCSTIVRVLLTFKTDLKKEDRINLSDIMFTVILTVDLKLNSE